MKSMTEPEHEGPPHNLRHPSPFIEWQHSLPSQVAAISPYIDRLMRFIKGFMNKLGAVEGSEKDIEMALHEALANAVIRGNHQDLRKRIYISCRCQLDGDVLITVRDEGNGFDGPAIPDPTDPDRRLLPNGRGIYLICALMDEVSFEEHGNVLHMRKKLRAV